MSDMELVDTTAQVKDVDKDKSVKAIAGCFENAEQLTDRMRLHWEVWESATKRFSRFATVVAILFGASYALNQGFWANFSILNNAVSLTSLDASRLNNLKITTSVANGFSYDRSGVKLARHDAAPCARRIRTFSTQQLHARFTNMELERMG